MKKLLLLLLSCPLLAQVQGKVTDTSGQPLPFVSVLVENSYNGTTTNDGGQYELAVKQPGHYVIVFQYLGFKTKKVAVDYTGQPFPLDVSLADENIALHEVVIGTDENPANEIIRKAIANRGENAGKTAIRRKKTRPAGLSRPHTLLIRASHAIQRMRPSSSG